MTARQMLLAPLLLGAGLASLAVAVVTFNSFGLVLLGACLLVAGLAAADSTGEQ
jgi:hypothetical protein